MLELTIIETAESRTIIDRYYAVQTILNDVTLLAGQYDSVADALSALTPVERLALGKRVNIVLRTRTTVLADDSVTTTESIEQV